MNEPKVPPRLFLTTTLILEVDATTYARGKTLSGEELCRLIVDAALSGNLKHTGIGQAKMGDPNG